jgi:hypothetical protein
MTDGCWRPRQKSCSCTQREASKAPAACLLLAQSGHGAVSELSPLCDQERTSAQRDRWHEKTPSALDGVQFGRATRDHIRAARYIMHDSGVAAFYRFGVPTKSPAGPASSKQGRRDWRRRFNGSGISRRRSRQRKSAGRQPANLTKGYGPRGSCDEQGIIWSQMG